MLLKLKLVFTSLLRFTGEIASPMDDYDMDEDEMADDFDDMPAPRR
jgi:hypothetical protein